MNGSVTTIGKTQVQYLPPAPPPIDPRLKVLLLAVRRALLTLADGIAEYIGLQK